MPLLVWLLYPHGAERLLAACPDFPLPDALLIAEDLQLRTLVHCDDPDLWDAVHPMVYDQLCRVQYPGRSLDALLRQGRVYFVAVEDGGGCALYCDERHRLYRVAVRRGEDGSLPTAAPVPAGAKASLALFEWTVSRATPPPPDGLSPEFQQVLPADEQWRWLVRDALKILAGTSSDYRKGLFLYRGCHGVEGDCITLLYTSPSRFLVVIGLVVGSAVLETMPLASLRRFPALVPYLPQDLDDDGEDSC